MRALLALILALLGGCAHLLAGHPAWDCHVEAGAGEVTASSLRSLDRHGVQVKALEEWSPRDLDYLYRAQWTYDGPRDSPVEGVVTLRLNLPPRAPFRPYRLELRRTAANGPAVVRGKTALPPELRLSWSQMNSLLSTPKPLFLVAVDRSGAVVRAQAVPGRLFAAGLMLAKKVAAESLAKSADFHRLCQPHADIILT